MIRIGEETGHLDTMLEKVAIWYDQELDEQISPDIARALQDQERDVLKEMERMAGRRVTIKPDALLHHEQFDLMLG